MLVPAVVIKRVTIDLLFQPLHIAGFEGFADMRPLVVFRPGSEVLKLASLVGRHAFEHFFIVQRLNSQLRRFIEVFVGFRVFLFGFPGDRFVVVIEPVGLIAGNGRDSWCSENRT